MSLFYITFKYIVTAHNINVQHSLSKNNQKNNKPVNKNKNYFSLEQHDRPNNFHLYFIVQFGSCSLSVFGFIAIRSIFAKRKIALIIYELNENEELHRNKTRG